MTTIKHEWWVTPVWEIETGFDSKFNDDLLVEIAKCTPPANPYAFNIWDYQTPKITELKNKILDSVKANASGYFPKFFRFNPVLTRGWVNRQRPGQSLALHDHGGTLLACSYYIKSAENCGDLLMVDPRGGVNWEWIQEGNISGIKYNRIKPSEGKLVIFPAYVMHMVEPNQSQSVRISLATNVFSN
jgi:uncharacterized protein (TIGR02466 family)